MTNVKIPSCRRYPLSAKQQRIEGTVVVRFVILVDGTVKDTQVIRSSGSQILDEECLSTIHRSAPFPSFSDTMPVSSLTIESAIVFRLN